MFIVCKFCTPRVNLNSTKYLFIILGPPIFVSIPKSQENPPSITTRFTCAALGSPTPTIQWYKNGEPLYINGRIEQVIKKENLYSLSITQTILSDSGVYQCTANNSVGTVSVAARLHVIKRGKYIFELSHCRDCFWEVYDTQKQNVILVILDLTILFTMITLKF